MARGLKGPLFHNLTNTGFRRFFFLTASSPWQDQCRHCCWHSWQWLVPCLWLGLHKRIWFSDSSNYSRLLTTCCGPCTGHGSSVLHFIGCFCCPYADFEGLGHSLIILGFVQTLFRRSPLCNFLACNPAFFVLQLFFLNRVLGGSALRI